MPRTGIRGISAGALRAGSNWVERAEPLVRGNTAERARVATLHGSVLSDMAHYDAALLQLRQAQAWADDDAAEAKQRIYAESMTGRVLVLTGKLDEAAVVLERCIGQARRMWTAFLPWPQSFCAEVDLLHGRIDQAADRFEHAFALGCQLADPCWEGIAGRGLGLVAAARGDGQGASAILVDTLKRCGRLPDAYDSNHFAGCQQRISGRCRTCPRRTAAGRRRQRPRLNSH